jgi:hypothetical protein
MKPLPRPLLWSALAFALTVGAVALARQEEPSPPLFRQEEPSPPLFDGISPLPETSNGPPVVRPSTKPSTRQTTPEEFIDSARVAATARVETLTTRRDELRKELEQVEEELAQWEAITKAIATVPQHYRGRNSIRPPQPTGASSPFDEPALDLPQPAGIDEPALPESTPSPFGGPATRPSNPFNLDVPESP